MVSLYNGDWDTTWHLILCRLPAAVQFVLTSQLSKAYPLKGGPLCDEDGSTLIAHVISNQWIIRYATQHQYQSLQLHTAASSLFDITSASAEQFKFEVNWQFFLFISVLGSVFMHTVYFIHRSFR